MAKHVNFWCAIRGGQTAIYMTKDINVKKEIFGYRHLRFLNILDESHMLNNQATILKLALVLIVASMPLKICAKEICKKGIIRFISNKKIEIIEENYCFNKKDLSLKSPNCQNEKCSVIRRAKKNPMNPQKLISTVGNPLFLYCHYISGSPQASEINFKGEWIPISRCIYEEDNSFVDLGTLSKIMTTSGLTH